LEAGSLFISSSTWAHVISIYAMIAVICYNFYVVQTQKEFFHLAMKLKKMTPVFHSINFAVFYTGVSLSAFTWDLSPTVILMIPTTLFLMISEIKRYKKMRVIKLAEHELQEEFKEFAKKIYIMQIMAIAIVYTIAVLF
jgi:hypothetical protein